MKKSPGKHGIERLDLENLLKNPDGKVAAPKILVHEALSY
jgi:hypothetical protein